MKRKHLKLLTTGASLLAVCGVMGVGIWAATSQTFKLTSNISFSATGIEASIFAQFGGTVKTTGDEGNKVTGTIGSVNMKSDTYNRIAYFSIEDTATQPQEQLALTFEFEDRAGDGYLTAPSAAGLDLVNTATTVEYAKLSIVVANTSANNINMWYQAIPSFVAGSNVQVYSITTSTTTVTKNADLTTATVATPSGTVAMTTANNAAELVASAGDYNAVVFDITLTAKKTTTSLSDTGFSFTLNMQNVDLTSTADTGWTLNQQETLTLAENLNITSNVITYANLAVTQSGVTPSFYYAVYATQGGNLVSGKERVAISSSDATTTIEGLSENQVVAIWAEATGYEASVPALFTVGSDGVTLTAVVGTPEGSE